MDINELAQRKVNADIKECLVKSKSIEIRGVGILETFTKKGRRYYCTRTKKLVFSSDKKSVHFKTSRSMLRDLNDKRNRAGRRR